MRRDRAAAVLLLVTAITAADPAGALDLMTGDGFLLALAEGEAERSGAADYLAGTIDSLIVINEVAASQQGGLFCLGEDRAKLLDRALLRREFVTWLRSSAAGATSDLAAASLPVPMLAWSFMARKFPCGISQSDTLDDGVRSRLLDSVPK